MYNQTNYDQNADGPPKQKGHNINDSLLSSDSDDEKWGKFSKRSVRLNFVKKVYSILFVQLFFTALIVMIPMFNSNAREFFTRNRSMLWITFAGVLIIPVVLICYRKFSR